MILCAGLGTRLRPLTDELPKPLVPVGDRPLLAHITERLVRAGFEEIVINTHYRPWKFQSVISSLNGAFQVIHEPVIRGTGGALAGARAVLEPPVIVHNGDIFAQPPFEAARRSAGASGGVCLVVAPRRCGEGTVGLDATGRVTRLRGRAYGEEVAGGDYIGVASVGSRALAALPETGCLIGDWVLPALERGEHVPAVRTDAPWSDVGDVRSYHALNLGWLRARGFRSWIGQGASVPEAADVRESIVGQGAELEGEGALERCVVWPGARVRLPLCDSVVTGRGVVVSVAPAPPVWPEPSAAKRC